MSRPVAPAPDHVSSVPRRMRQLLAVLAAVVVGVGLYMALTLQDNVTGVVEFGTADQIAVAGIGLLLGAGILYLGRLRVEADAESVRIRNLAVRHELPWTMIRAVAFDPKSPWASLLLRNGDEVSLLAVQAVDRERAVDAVEGLRALLAAAKAKEPAPPPLLYDD